MKYFTQEWHELYPDNHATKQIRKDYHDHLISILPGLPTMLQELATSTNLHDGLFRRVCWDSINRNLELGLRCGDLQVGYFDLDIVYLSTTQSDTDISGIVACAENPESEILYDEIDVDQPKYTHRILLWPYKEVEICFSDFSMRKTPVGSKKVQGVEICLK